MSRVKGGPSGRVVGWVDFYLVGCRATTVATFSPSRMVEHHSVKATQLSEQMDHPVERLTWMGSLELEEEDALWLRVSI